MTELTDKERHDLFTRTISLKPKIIGLDGIVLSTAESNLFLGPKIVRQPDNLLFNPATRTIYNLEYKTKLSSSSYQHSLVQLDSCRDNLLRVFPDWRIVNLFVYENYKFEIVR